jgi:hypothetical protein
MRRIWSLRTVCLLCVEDRREWAARSLQKRAGQLVIQSMQKWLDEKEVESEVVKFATSHG